MDYLNVVKSIIGKRIDINKLKEDDVLTELGMDSLDLVESMLEIEDALKIEFSSNEISCLKTIKDVVNLIEQKIK